MPTISAYIPTETGNSGLSLTLRKMSDFLIVNTGGDALTEDGTTGNFEATIEETHDENCYALIYDGSDLIATAELAVGKTACVAPGGLALADIQTRLPAALANGKMDASVGAYQSGQVPFRIGVQTKHTNTGGGVNDGDEETVTLTEV